MKREAILAHIKFAGYHNDIGRMTQLYIESGRKVSYESAQKAFAAGKQAKINGVKCNCTDCKNRE